MGLIHVFTRIYMVTKASISLHAYAGVKISSTRKRDVTSSKWVLQTERLRAQHYGSWYSAMQRRTDIVLTHMVNQTIPTPFHH